MGDGLRDTGYLIVGRRRRQARETTPEDCTPVMGLSTSKTQELTAAAAAAELDAAFHAAGLTEPVPAAAVLVRVEVLLTPAEASRLAQAVKASSAVVQVEISDRSTPLSAIVDGTLNKP